MSEKAKELLTVGKIAQATGATPGEVKKVIEALAMQPSVVKGGCSYYDAEATEKIKSALNKA